MQVTFGVSHLYFPHVESRGQSEGPPVIWVREESDKDERGSSSDTWNCNMKERKRESLLVAYVVLS